jgi:beta-N-acetylhexosaminidase
MIGPLVVDVEGTALSAEEADRLRHPLVGMVILFARNFASSRQLVELTAQIRSLRTTPLLIAVDHEGGRVQRFRQAPFTRLPAMRTLGQLWDTDPLQACRTALAVGFVLAAELRAHGVDLSFAPVLDLDWGRSDVIGDRALHRDPRCVALLASHTCHGMALAGMANCGKHFPGHGWAEADSHVAVPVDGRGQDEILAADAAPYGWMGVGLAGVMPAHVIYPQVDPLPAGFSRRWLQGILRERLGFAGAVFSDDLSMAGARVAGDVVDSAQQALDAGCDFVLVCNAPEQADQVLDRLKWRSTEEFAQRAVRLRPAGPAPTIDALVRSAPYRAALRDVETLQRQAAGGTD